MNLKAFVRTALIAGAAATTLIGVQAQAATTRGDVEAIVHRAVAYVAANGAAKAYGEFNNPTGSFVSGELYISVYSLAGVVLAHGHDAASVGKDKTGSTDTAGTAYVARRIQLAATQASFWQDYKPADPVTKAPVDRSVFCERASDTIVCSGYNH